MFVGYKYQPMKITSKKKQVAVKEFIIYVQKGINIKVFKRYMFVYKLFKKKENNFFIKKINLLQFIDFFCISNIRKL